MIGVFWGLVGAVGIGTGDFIAWFTSRRFGVLFAVFSANLMGSIFLGVGLYFWGGIPEAGVRAWGLAILSGIFGLAGLSMLYLALARGPVAIASPVVAAHPALVALFWGFLGISPLVLQWIGIIITLTGAVSLGAMAQRRQSDYTPEHVWVTFGIAFAAMLVIAARLIVAQEAAVELGATLATLISRVVPVCIILIILVARLARGGGGLEGLTMFWVILLIFHGILETGGSWAVLAGSQGVGRAVAPVVFSAFTAITVLLARIILKEPVRYPQWGAIGTIIAGIAVLGYAGTQM